MLDGVDALNRVDDLNGRANADAIDDARDAAAFLVAAFGPNVVVLVFSPVGFTDAIAGAFPDGAALIRLGDFDRVRAAGGWSNVGLRAHADALDAAVDAETTLVASVIPSVSFDVLDVFVDAGLGQMLTFVDRAAFSVRDVADGDAAVGAGRRERRRATLSAVDFTGAAVAAFFAAVVKDLLVLVLLSFVLTGRQLFADPNVAASFFVLDLLGMRAFRRGRKVDERRAPADALDLSVEGTDASRVASLEEGLALRNGSSVVVAKVDFVATLPVVAALAVLAEVLRLRARVLRRHETHDAFRAAADLARVTFAVPVASVLERLAVLVPSAFVQARPVDHAKIAFPPEDERREKKRFLLPQIGLCFQIPINHETGSP